jgi:hypothetical protein
MTRDEYIQRVQHVLAEHTATAASRLSAALTLVPAKTRNVAIEIFVDQDGEGCLDVQVTLEGPDHYFLNRAIASQAELFGTRMTQSGLEPDLPLMAPGAETFSVHDALTDCAALWIKQVWEQTERGRCPLPITIVSHDGYGTIPPLPLDP